MGCLDLADRSKWKIGLKVINIEVNQEAAVADQWNLVDGVGGSGHLNLRSIRSCMPTCIQNVEIFTDWQIIRDLFNKNGFFMKFLK